MVDPQTLVILSNTIIMSATLLATLYRIKIERDQIKLLLKQAKLKDTLAIFRKYVHTEKDEILNMKKSELKCFLDELEYIGED